MCWSFEVSALTFIASLTAFIYLCARNKKNDRFYAIYILVVGIMQGVEALAWYSINHQKETLNRWSAVLSHVAIWSQPLIVYAYLYGSTRKSVFLLGLCVLSAYMIKVFYEVATRFESYKITVSRVGCHLEWSWLPERFIFGSFIYFLLLAYPMLALKDRRRPYMILMVILTLTYALYECAGTRAWAGYWCLTANLWIPVAVLM
jgi:hypothetical protein